MENFLGMNRQVLNHWVYSDIYAWRVWSHILFSAQFSKTDNHVNVNGYWITQEYGEFLFGRDSWSSKLQVPEQRLRTLMKKFEKEEMIRKTEKGNSRCSVYAVCNYAKFNQTDNQHANQQNSLEPQAFEEDANQHSNHDANQRPTSNQPATNHNKEYKKKEEEYKEDKNKYKQQRYFDFDELNDAFMSYIEMRKKIKAPMTDKAIKIAINKLNKLASADDYKKIAIINESVLNNWKGLYEYNGKIERPEKPDPIQEKLETPGTIFFDVNKYLKEEGGIDGLDSIGKQERKNW